MGNSLWENCVCVLLPFYRFVNEKNSAQKLTVLRSEKQNIEQVQNKNFSKFYLYKYQTMYRILYI